MQGESEKSKSGKNNYECEKIYVWRGKLDKDLCRAHQRYEQRLKKDE